MKKTGAIELSIGTIVIVVLAMSMLILGIILIKNIFSGTTDAVTATNEGVINEINELFTDTNQRLAFAPSTRKIKLAQGIEGQGFAFSIRNTYKEEKTFEYNVEVDDTFDIRRCSGANFNDLNSWLVVNSGSVTLAPGQKMQQAIMMMYEIPEDAPLCVIPYKVRVDERGGGVYEDSSVYVTIEPK